MTSPLKWRPVCYCLSLCSFHMNLRLVAVKGRRSFVAKYATKVWVSFFWGISIKHKAALCPQKMRRGMLIRPALQTSPCHSHLAAAASAGGLVAAAPGPCASPRRRQKAPVYVSLRSRGSDSGVNAVNPIANLPHVCILPLVRCMVLEVGRVAPRVKGSRRIVDRSGCARCARGSEWGHGGPLSRHRGTFRMIKATVLNGFARGSYCWHTWTSPYRSLAGCLHLAWSSLILPHSD